MEDDSISEDLQAGLTLGSESGVSSTAIETVKVGMPAKLLALTPRRQNALDAAIKNDAPVLTPRRGMTAQLNGLEAALKSDVPVRTPRRDRAHLMNGLEAAAKTEMPIKRPQHETKDSEQNFSQASESGRFDSPFKRQCSAGRRPNALEASLKTDVTGTPMKCSHPDGSLMDMTQPEQDASMIDNYVKLDLPPKRTTQLRPNGLEAALKTPIKTPVKSCPFSDSSVLSQSMLSCSLLPELSVDESKNSETTPWKQDSKVQILSPAREVFECDLILDAQSNNETKDGKQASGSPPELQDTNTTQVVVEATVEIVCGDSEFKVEDLATEGSDGVVTGEVGFLGSKGLHGGVMGRRLLGGQFTPLSDSPQKRPALLRMSRSSVGQVFDSPVPAEFTRKHLDHEEDDEKASATEQGAGVEDRACESNTELEQKLSDADEQLKYWETVAKHEELDKSVDPNLPVGDKIAYWEGVADHERQSLLAEEQRKSLLSSMYESRRSLAASCNGRTSFCGAERHDSEIQCDLLGETTAPGHLAPFAENESLVVDISAAPGGSYVPLDEAESMCDDTKADLSMCAEQLEQRESLPASQEEEERESLLSTEEKMQQQQVTFPVVEQDEQEEEAAEAEASDSRTAHAYIAVQPAHFTDILDGSPQLAAGARDAADVRSDTASELECDLSCEEEQEVPRGAPPSCLKASQTSRRLAGQSLARASAEAPMRPAGLEELFGSKQSDGGRSERRSALQQAALSVNSSANDSISRMRPSLTPKRRGSSRLAGIGVQLKRINGFVTVVDLAPRGPAAEKLSKGDVIIAIDQLQTRYLPFSSILQLLRGPAESSVTLTIVASQDEAQQSQVTLTRARLSASTPAKHATMPADLPTLHSHRSQSPGASDMEEQESQDQAGWQSRSLLVPEDISDISPTTAVPPASQASRPARRTSPPCSPTSLNELPEQQAAASVPEGLPIDSLHSLLLQHLQARAEAEAGTRAEEVKASSCAEREGRDAQDADSHDSTSTSTSTSTSDGLSSADTTTASTAHRAKSLQLTPAKQHLQVPGFAEHRAVDKSSSSNISAINVASPIHADLSTASAVSLLTARASTSTVGSSRASIEHDASRLLEDSAMAPAHAAAAVPKGRAAALDNPNRKRVRTRDAPANPPAKGPSTRVAFKPASALVPDENRQANSDLKASSTAPRAPKRPLAPSSNNALAPPTNLRRELRGATKRPAGAESKTRCQTGSTKAAPKGRYVGTARAEDGQVRRREGKGIFRGRVMSAPGDGGGRDNGKDGAGEEGWARGQEQYYQELGKMMEDLVKEIAPTEGPLDPGTVIQAISSLAAAGRRRLPSVGEEDAEEGEEEEGEAGDAVPTEAEHEGGGERKRKVGWEGAGQHSALVQEVMGLGRKGRWRGLYVGEDGDEGGREEGRGFQPFEEILRDRFALESQT